jgi:hypothetical protein
MSDSINKPKWEKPQLEGMDIKQNTKSGIIILPLEILGVQGPS